MFIFAEKSTIMDINKKKVLLIRQDALLSENRGLTDFHVRQDVLDRIKSLNIGYVAILFDKEESKVKMKAVEYLVFAYCKVGVSTHNREETFVEEIMQYLQHNMRKRESFLSIGQDIEGVDNISLKDFL